MKKLLLAVLLVALSLATSLPGAALAQTDDKEVKASDALAVASQYQTLFTARFPDWEKAAIRTSAKYHGIDGNAAAYEFSLELDGRTVGFILISATREWTPLLECSTGLPPSYRIDDARKAAVKSGYLPEGSNEEPLLLYWSSLSYCVQFGEKMKSERVAIELPTGVQVSLPKEQPTLQLDPVAAESDWRARLSGAGDTLLSSGYINGVPAWYQTSYWDYPNCDVGGGFLSYPDCVGIAADPWYDWDGCSPIAGAMVIGYWDTHGYSNFPSDDESLIDHAHYFMNTSNDGVTLPYYDILEGMFGMCNYWYPSSFTTSDDYLLQWSDITGLVDAAHPAMLNMTDQQYYGDHSVTVVGYSNSAGINNIWIRNTWDTSDHIISYGTWSYAFLTEVTPN